MRWFKHYSDASSDQDISKLIDEFGGDGYMFYWRVIEVIASQMKPENTKTNLDYSYKKWAESCGLSQQKFKKICDFVSTLSLLILKKREKSCEIDCPKLLEIKDNHFKNLQAAGNKLAPKIKKEIKKEIYKENKQSDLLEEYQAKLYEYCGCDFGIQLVYEFDNRHESQVINGITQLIDSGKKPRSWNLVKTFIENSPIGKITKTKANSHDPYGELNEPDTF